MLGDDTRKPNRLTLTPETLLTPAALHEAEAEELKLEIVEVVVGGDLGMFFTADCLDCQSACQDRCLNKFGPL